MHTLWTDVDAFINAHVAPQESYFTDALTAAAAAGLPAIQVSPSQGKLLMLLAKIQGSRRILEIGTLAGYSTLWLARALPDGGRMVTLELDPAHAAVAQSNFMRAGVASMIELRVGPALRTLEQMASEKSAPFDFTFIDADKASTPEYFDWAIRLSRGGSVIVVDNVVRDGSVIDQASSDASVLGTRRFFAQAAKDARVSVTAVQTVGEKGYDGLAVARVN